MLRLLCYKEQGCKDFFKSSKPCHIGIHRIALAEQTQMSTHKPSFLHQFVLAKLATSSIRVKRKNASNGRSWDQCSSIHIRGCSHHRSRSSYYVKDTNWSEEIAFTYGGVLNSWVFKIRGFTVYFFTENISMK